MNKYIYLLAVVFGLSSCNDFLELSPTNKVIETDYYKTQEDLTEALVAAYDPLKWNAYNAYSSYELVSNIMSDDAETGGSTVSDLSLIHIFFNAIVSFTFFKILKVFSIPGTDLTINGESQGNPAGAFLFYAFIGIVAIIWGYFYVPETKGVSLENIEAFWRKGGHPKDKII